MLRLADDSSAHEKMRIDILMKKHKDELPIKYLVGEISAHQSDLLSDDRRFVLVTHNGVLRHSKSKEGEHWYICSSLGNGQVFANGDALSQKDPIVYIRYPHMKFLYAWWPAMDPRPELPLYVYYKDIVKFIKT